MYNVNSDGQNEGFGMEVGVYVQVQDDMTSIRGDEEDIYGIAKFVKAAIKKIEGETG